MDFSILIPTQEIEVAKQLIEYAHNHMGGDMSIALRVAHQLADMKYWEAYDCDKPERIEYWRLVKIALDSITDYRAFTFK